MKKLLCSSHFIFPWLILCWAFLLYWNPLPSEFLDPSVLKSLLYPFFLFYHLPVLLFLYLDLIYYMPLPKGPSVHFSHSFMSDSLWLNGMQHSRPPCPSSTPRVYSNSCPLSQWYPPNISSSVIPFSSCLQSFLASGSFKWVMSSHQVAKVLKLQFQHQSFQWIFRVDFLDSELTGLISLLSKGLSRVFSKTTIQKHQFFGEMGASKTLLVQIGRWESCVNVSCGSRWLGSSELCRKW